MVTAIDPGVVRLAPIERAVLLSVRDFGRPHPVLRSSSRYPHAERLVARGLLVLRWTSSDRAFDYYGLTALGDEVARISGAS